MIKATIILVQIVLLCACSPSPQAIQQAVLATMSVIPTQTPYPTQTPVPTYTTNPTYTAYPTFTAYPTLIPTATLSPTPESSPTLTSDPLFGPKPPGIYLVNVDIAPGIWRSQGSGINCYWGITNRTGDTLSNHFGQAGGTLYLSPDAFQVEMKPECGDWIYLGPP